MRDDVQAIAHRRPGRRGARPAAIGLALLAGLLMPAAPALSQTPPKPAAGPLKLSDHVRKDIERHRAMAAAHEAAARCLESGKAEEQCLKELQVACKGLGIGKYCGMRHEH